MARQHDNSACKLNVLTTAKLWIFCCSSPPLSVKKEHTLQQYSTKLKMWAIYRKNYNCAIQLSYPSDAEIRKH